ASRPSGSRSRTRRPTTISRSGWNGWSGRLRPTAAHAVVRVPRVRPPPTAVRATSAILLDIVSLTSRNAKPLTPRRQAKQNGRTRMVVHVAKGSVAQLPVDAVVTPSSIPGVMVGTSAHELRERGGPALELEARALAPIAVGAAIVTGPGALYCKHVIHVP